MEPRTARRSSSVSRGMEGCGLDGDLMAPIEVGLGLGGCGGIAKWLWTKIKGVVP